MVLDGGRNSIRSNSVIIRSNSVIIRSKSADGGCDDKSIDLAILNNFNINDDTLITN